MANNNTVAGALLNGAMITHNVTLSTERQLEIALKFISQGKDNDFVKWHEYVTRFASAQKAEDYENKYGPDI